MASAHVTRPDGTKYNTLGDALGYRATRYGTDKITIIVLGDKNNDHEVIVVAEFSDGSIMSQAWGSLLIALAAMNRSRRLKGTPVEVAFPKQVIDTFRFEAGYHGEHRQDLIDLWQQAHDLGLVEGIVEGGSIDNYI